MMSEYTALSNNPHVVSLTRWSVTDSLYSGEKNLKDFPEGPPTLHPLVQSAKRTVASLVTSQSAHVDVVCECMDVFVP